MLLLSGMVVLLTGTPIAPSPELGALVQGIVAESGPLRIEDRPGWGDTVRLFDGWKPEGRGLRMQLRIRQKEVPHGLWQHYRLQVVDPARDLQIRFPRLQFVPGRGIEFIIEIDARLDAYANIQQHANGLQLFAAATEGLVDTRIRLTGVVGVTLDPQRGGWDLLLAPQVEQVELAITNIDVDRFGKLRGRLVHETGDSFRRLLDDLVDDNEEKVVRQINREIDKRWEQGTLRVPLTRWLSNSLPSLPAAGP